jgi:hypothetical protein
MKDDEGNEFVDNAEGVWGHLSCYHGQLFLLGGDDRMMKTHAEHHEKPCDHPIETLAYNAEKAHEYLMEEIGDTLKTSE